jgi:hypothetical protein
VIDVDPRVAVCRHPGGEYRSRITATANGNCVTHCVDTSSTGDPTADAMSNRKTIQAVNQMVECAHPAADRAWTV